MNCKSLMAMCIFLLFNSIPLSAAPQRQIADKKASAAQLSAIRQLVSNYMKENLIPGMSLAVVSEDVMVYTAGFGKADLENAVDVTPSTTFPSASTLKLITAAAVMQLMERGKLDLTESIQHYCAAYPVKKWRISLKDLLKHQAGLEPERGSQVFNREHYKTVKDAVSAFASNELAYEPGTKTSYSNDGYTLLACAIEEATGQTYAEYVASHILQPAGMISTEPDDGYRILRHRARGYVVRTQENTKDWAGLWTPAQLAAIPIGVPVNADPVDPTRNPGAAGFIVTPTDLARLVIAIDEDKILSAASRREMTQAQRTKTGDMTDYGFGWMVKNEAGVPTLRLFGSVWNGSSAILFYPERKFAVVICTNEEFQQPLKLANDIARLWKIPY